MIDLAKLRSLAEAATPGPWKQIGECVVDERDSPVVRAYGLALENRLSKNAAFVSAANPAAVLELIARCEYAEECGRQKYKANVALRTQLATAKSALESIEWTTSYNSESGEKDHCRADRSLVNKALESLK